MYLDQILGLFYPFPKIKSVFVIMSFDGNFESRWEDIVAPAISNTGLNPVRVDSRHVGKLASTEIVNNITHSTLVFADISTGGKNGDKVMRNSDVIYEIGVAHSYRLPEEVLIFRSDKCALPFNLKNFQVTHYDPEKDPEAAKSTLIQMIEDAQLNLDLKRHSVVEHVAKSLDITCWRILDEAARGGIELDRADNQKDFSFDDDSRVAVRQLLHSGLLETDVKGWKEKTSRRGLDGEFALYQITPFGKLVLDHLFEGEGLFTTVRTMIEGYL